MDYKRRNKIKIEGATTRRRVYVYVNDCLYSVPNSIIIPFTLVSQPGQDHYWKLKLVFRNLWLCTQLSAIAVEI